VLNDPHSKLGDAGTITIPPKVAALAAALAPLAPIPGPGPGGTTRVSDPSLDFATSVMSSFTQSETSSAWCGNSVVAGYNDSGAFARTAGVNFDAAWSFSSASYSSDGGRSFVDIGVMNPGTNPINFIVGDPVLACTSPTQFYYASIFASGQTVAVTTSTAWRSTFRASRTYVERSRAAVAKDFSHAIDKPWLAADPTNAKRLYVSYTDFDFSFISVQCPNDIRIAIELASSADGGTTWGAPVVVRHECLFASGGSAVQGSNLAVAPDGTLYVGYEFYPATGPTSEIHLVKSTDHGQTYGAPVKVPMSCQTKLRTVAGELPQQRIPPGRHRPKPRLVTRTIYVAWWMESITSCRICLSVRDLRLSRRDGGEVKSTAGKRFAPTGREPAAVELHGPGSRSVLFRASP